MEILLDKQQENLASIKIILNEEDYKSKVDKKLVEYSKTANMKGFRPGKVPPALIKKLYGKSILLDELNHIISHSLFDYIKDNNLDIIGDPLPIEDEKMERLDLNTQKEFEFSFKVGLVPDFHYDLSSFQPIKYVIALGENEVKESIEQLQKRFGKFENPEISEKGDILVGKILKKGEEVQETADGKTNEKFAFIVWEELKEEVQPIFEGLKIGDKRDFDIKNTLKEDKLLQEKNIFAFSMTQEEFEAAEGEYVFTLERLNRMKPAEMNQEFFETVFGPESVNTEEEFIAKVKENISENYERESDGFVFRQIEDHLMETIHFDLPDEFIKDWLYQVNKTQKTREDIENEYGNIIKDIKWSLIVNKISKEHAIEVTDEEIQQRVANMFFSYLSNSQQMESMLPHLESYVKNYLETNNGENARKIFAQIRDEKTIQHLKDTLNLKSEDISKEEFEKKIAALKA